jgi:hypothetical protein
VPKGAAFSRPDFLEANRATLPPLRADAPKGAALSRPDFLEANRAALPPLRSRGAHRHRFPEASPPGTPLATRRLNRLPSPILGDISELGGLRSGVFGVRNLRQPSRVSQSA